jgi:hypothetical protein
MSDKRDLSGVWYGSYRGDFGNEAGFIAHLEESAGSFDGSITEPDQRGSGAILRATVSGQRDGATLRFVKQYDGSGGWTHAVRYSGRIDNEGTMITGVWIVDWLRGTFSMEREKFTEEALEAEAEIELPEAVGER